MKNYKDIIPLLIIVGGFAFFVLTCTIAHKYGDHRAEIITQSEYAAWCKLTGNEKQLTIKEFEVLRDGRLITVRIK